MAVLTEPEQPAKEKSKLMKRLAFFLSNYELAFELIL
jgi:hypothetical protein